MAFSSVPTVFVRTPWVATLEHLPDARTHDKC